MYEVAGELKGSQGDIELTCQGAIKIPYRYENFALEGLRKMQRADNEF